MPKRHNAMPARRPYTRRDSGELTRDEKRERTRKHQARLINELKKACEARLIESGAETRVSRSIIVKG